MICQQLARRCACLCFALLATVALAADTAQLDASQPTGRLDFEVKIETVLRHDDGKWLWFHPRVAAVPRGEANQTPLVVMTLQKHLRVSDYYSGLSLMQTSDLGRTWTEPEPRAELAWQSEPEGVTLAVADVTPGWHPQTGKMLLVGARVRYSDQGKQLEDAARSHQTAYAVYDPRSNECSQWRVLEMPADAKFNFAQTPVLSGWCGPMERCCCHFIFPLRPRSRTRSRLFSAHSTASACGTCGTATKLPWTWIVGWSNRRWLASRGATI